MESSFNGAHAATLSVFFDGVAPEIRRKMQRRVDGHSLGRTGKRPEEKIYGGEGAPPHSGSAASSFTAHGVDQPAQQGQVGGGEPSHPQMQKTASADSSPGISSSSSTDARVDGDRVLSHGQASTSPRCGFKCVELQLQETLDQKRRWDESTIEGGFDDQHYNRHCVEIERGSIHHIIGVWGRMLRKIEDFCGIFIMISDCEDSCEVSLLGLPYAYIFGGFIIEMLNQGYSSILEFLMRHGW